MLIHKLTIALTVASGAAMLASSCRAETARERREKLFKADQEVLIREHQIGLELKSGKISREEAARLKKDVQDRAVKARADK